jgi:hypothetical protein
VHVIATVNSFILERGEQMPSGGLVPENLVGLGHSIYFLIYRQFCRKSDGSSSKEFIPGSEDCPAGAMRSRSSAAGILKILWFLVYYVEFG